MPESTPTTPHIDLDLGALAGPTVTVRDRRGKIWEIDQTPPLLTMLKLYKLTQQVQAADDETNLMEYVVEVISGVHTIFQYTYPDVTEEEIAAAFNIPAMLQLISFLFTGDATSADAAPSIDTAGAKTTTTKTRRTSAGPSPAAS